MTTSPPESTSTEPPLRIIDGADLPTMPPTRDDRRNWLLSFTVVPITSLALWFAFPVLHHWFMLPIAVGGMLIAVDAFGWLFRGNIFDPQSILGIFGVGFFYLAPMFHLILDYWPPGIEPHDPEWRNLLGAMAVLNMVGLAIYRSMVGFPWNRNPDAPRRELDERRFVLIASVAVAIGVAAFVVSVVVLGGPVGYFEALTSNRGSLTGLGGLILIGESFPLMLLVLLIVRFRARLRRQMWLVVALLLGLLVLQLFVGGLRGSRAALLWPALLGLIMVHYLVRPITRRAFLSVAIGVIAVTFIYGLYKGVGVSIMDIARGTQPVSAAVEKTNRGLPTLLLGDLGRSDIQAIVLERARDGDIDYGMGSTYLSAPLSLVPRTTLEESFPSKSEIGTDVLVGPGTWASGVKSQRVFGITGEAILNFGILGGLLSFGVLGLAIRFARGYSNSALAGQALPSRIAAVVLSPLAILLVLMDLDNVLFFSLTYLAPLLLVTWLSLDRTKARRAQQTAPRIQAGRSL